ncbi:hypothetical protein [Bacillus cereus]|nr:hypothetical protein [Bacillus cereus]
MRKNQSYDVLKEKRKEKREKRKEKREKRKEKREKRKERNNFPNRG